MYPGYTLVGERMIIDMIMDMLVDMLSAP